MTMSMLPTDASSSLRDNNMADLLVAKELRIIRAELEKIRDLLAILVLRAEPRKRKKRES